MTTFDRETAAAIFGRPNPTATTATEPLPAATAAPVILSQGSTPATMPRHDPDTLKMLDFISSPHLRNN